MLMSSCDAGKPSPGGPRSTKLRANRSTSASTARSEINRDPPMARKAFVFNETLRKRCRDDLDRGIAEANAMVSGSLFAAAKGGNVPAQIFWLKTRAHWRERPVPGHPAPDGEVEATPPMVLLLPDNSRDPDLTQALRDAQEKQLPRKPRR